MSENASTIPPKGYGKVGFNDLAKGALIVSFGHITAMIIFLIRQDHWPSWVEWQPYVEAGVYTLLGYVGKNLVTNNAGQLFKQDQPLVTVGAEELEKELEKTKTP